MCGARSQALAWLVLGTVLAGANSARGDGRPPNEILAEIDNTPLPPRPLRQALKDKTVADEYAARLDAALERRGTLTRELWTCDPNNNRLPRLLGETWLYRLDKVTERRNHSIRALAKAGADEKQLFEEADRPWFDDLADEMAGVLAATKNPKVKLEVMYWKAELAAEAKWHSIHALPAIEEFIRLAPKDDRGAKLLYDLALMSSDPVTQEVLLPRLIADYPHSAFVPRAELLLTELAGVGKPFELVFRDATTGKRIALADLRGKVVVLDLWATWCGPCVDEMPKMKALYEQFRGQGVAFIGISFDRPKDEGGLDRLKDFVAKNQVPWPQFYWHEGAETVPSILNGGLGIPQVWVVDQEGKLYSTHARGKLETMLPELLKKGRGKIGTKR